MGSRSVGAAVLLAACLTLPIGPAAADPDPVTPHLTVEPGAAVALAVVEATGSCPALDDPGPEQEEPLPEPGGEEPAAPGLRQAPVDEGARYPETTTLLLDGEPLRGPFELTEGEFTGVDMQIPDGTSPGGHRISTDCGGVWDFEVLDAPALEVTPVEAVRGQVIIVTGTCAATVEETTIAFDDADVTVVPLETSGRLGNQPVRIPDDAAAVEHTVTTTCGGRDTVVVMVPVDPQPGEPDGPEQPGNPEEQETPEEQEVPDEPGNHEEPGDREQSEDPDEDLVTVPNLQGLGTETAATVLEAEGLVLAGVDGDRGPVTGQDPVPLTRVRVGTGVRIELAAAGATAFPLLPAAGGGLLLLLAAPLTVHHRRVRRERRWLDQDVRVTPEPGAPIPGAAPPGPVPGLDVRIEVHRHRWPPQPGGRAP